MNSCQGAARMASSAVLLVTLLGVGTAWANQPAIEEIVVTARKRAESLQDVPLSVSVFSDQEIRSRGLTSDFDVANFTVNFNTVQQVGRELDRPVIRGQAASAVRGEANASYFVDGVYVSSSISTATLDVVERVEILRGPQSAQFGRATFAGAVNYVTREPGDEWEGRISSRAGTSDDYKIGAWAGGPLLRERVQLLVSANWEKYGGQWNNTLGENEAAPTTVIWEAPLPPAMGPLPQQRADSSRLGNEETRDLLARLRILPWEGARINVKYSWTDADDGHFPSPAFMDLNCFLPTDPSQPWYQTSGGAWCGTLRIGDRRDKINLPDFDGGVVAFTRFLDPDGNGVVIEPAKPGTTRTTRRSLLEFVQDLNGSELVLRASYTDESFGQNFDLDHTPFRALFGLFNFVTEDSLRDYAYELRFASPASEPLRLQVGVYQYDLRLKERQRSMPGVQVITAPTFADKVAASQLSGWQISTTRNEAVFGAIDVDFLPQWTLGIEARYARDEKSQSSPNGVNAVATFSNFTPRFTVRWQPSDEVSLYALAALGNKPGDFNEEYFRGDIDPDATREALENGRATVDEEEAWTYELGAKTSWLDRRLTVNLAGFYIDWTNQAVFNRVCIDLSAGGCLLTTELANAGKSRTWGLELETAWAATDWLLLTAGYGLLDAKLQRYIDEFYAEVTGTDGDVSGFRIPNTPKHNLVLGASMTRDLNSDVELFLRTDLALESSRYVDVANFGKLDSRALLNLRGGFDWQGLRVTAYVRNLLDDDTPTAALNFIDFQTTLPNGVNPNFWSLNPQRGRDWGIEVEYAFGRARR